MSKRISILVALFLAAMVGCRAREEAPPIVSTEGNRIVEQAKPIMQAIRACYLSSFTIQRKLTPDRNQAAENAIAACATEERALAVVVSQNEYIPVANLITVIRAKAKAEMLAMA